ncbi:DUF1905 domain-containing protein [Nocardiopsis changdeensis]|uniref:DUF1905 domain-containing protein n=1 Tax=Nocardiopsis changdeensis TaxID=2831969 RepID=A0ABX8BG02_9ACTN|nr:MULTISPECIES: DUF1905 domain-containing protein [Nocardiopsis]QUX21165.1 DUF1905 domain-containing protein [Nocardiopsis changdeensis]QYX37095.1 DUF1905 domain-containing protein [Nocardiopsis sp. MT53]
MSADTPLVFEAELRTGPEAGSWTVFDVPGSAAFFGTRRPVRVHGTLDEVPVQITLMPTGNGGHMGSVKAATRKALGKEAGDRVRVSVAAVAP